MNQDSIDEKFSKEDLLNDIEESWNKLHAYLGTLSTEQLTSPTDAAGWTAKDHIIHLAVWENGINSLLDKRPRWEGMEVDRETFVNTHFDVINAAIQQAHRDMPLDAVTARFQEVHTRLLNKLEAMQEEQILLPYNHYAPDSSRTDPVLRWIVGNSMHHYEEHLPWIKAIVERQR